MESLRLYRQPVIIYLPPGAELRGGAWVVIDSQINSEQVLSLYLPGILFCSWRFLSAYAFVSWTAAILETFETS